MDSLLTIIPTVTKFQTKSLFRDCLIAASGSPPLAGELLRGLRPSLGPGMPQMGWHWMAQPR